MMQPGAAHLGAHLAHRCLELHQPVHLARHVLGRTVEEDLALASRVVGQLLPLAAQQPHLDPATECVDRFGRLLVAREERVQLLDERSRDRPVAAHHLEQPIEHLGLIPHDVEHERRRPVGGPVFDQRKLQAALHEDFGGAAVDAVEPFDDPGLDGPASAQPRVEPGECSRVAQPLLLLEPNRGKSGELAGSKRLGRIAEPLDRPPERLPCCDHAEASKSSRPISQRRISLVPAPIS